MCLWFKQEEQANGVWARYLHITASHIMYISEGMCKVSWLVVAFVALLGHQAFLKQLLISLTLLISKFWKLLILCCKLMLDFHHHPGAVLMKPLHRQSQDGGQWQAVGVGQKAQQLMQADTIQCFNAHPSCRHHALFMLHKNM